VRRVIIFTVFVAAASARVAAWGNQGHQIVAELAVAVLSQGSRDETIALLDGATLSSNAGYADDVRNARPDTKRWHFVDIPRGEAAYVAARDCAPEPEGDCVIAAIERSTHV
jgi:hypothetical protein